MDRQAGFTNWVVERLKKFKRHEVEYIDSNTEDLGALMAFLITK